MQHCRWAGTSTLWAGPSLARVRWESHSHKLSICRHQLPLAPTRGGGASRVSAPFSKGQTVLQPETTSPCGWALVYELAANSLLAFKGVTSPPPEALLQLACRRPLVSGRSMAMLQKRLFPRGGCCGRKGHKSGDPKVVGSCKTQLITLTTIAALIPPHATHSQTCVLARRGEAVRLAEG